jgi:uncharacterized protein
LIVLDTSGLLAAIDEAQEEHSAAAAALSASAGPLLLSPFVLAELDYLVRRNAGAGSRDELLKDVAAGAYELVPFSPDDLVRAQVVIARYRDLGISLADASVVVIAAAHGTHAVLTLDYRDFRAMSGLDGAPFQLLPSDGEGDG